MKRLGKYAVISLFVVCLMQIASAELGFDNANLPRVERIIEDISTFLGLDDVLFDSYSGKGGQCLIIDPGEGGITAGNCSNATGGGAGDITAVLGDEWITNGSVTGLVQFIFNRTLLEEETLNQTEADSIYLNLSGTNANQDINIGDNNFTTNRTLTSREALLGFNEDGEYWKFTTTTLSGVEVPYIIPSINDGSSHIGLLEQGLFLGTQLSDVAQLTFVQTGTTNSWSFDFTNSTGRFLLRKTAGMADQFEMQTNVTVNGTLRTDTGIISDDFINATGNITGDWGFMKINWSNIQNAPAFALITDVQAWILGNRTASEASLRADIDNNITQVKTDLRVDIDGNFTSLQNSKLNISDQRYNDTALILSINTTDNIVALNFSKGNHTIDTNFSACGDGEYGDGDGNCYNINSTVQALSLNQTEADLLYLNLSGTNANQDINISPFNIELPNITVREKVILGDQDHWLKRGAEEIFDGISTQAFWFHHDEEHEGGTVSFLLTANSSGQNTIGILAQVGRNNSAGVLGNSWIVIPNNLSSNLSILSNCFLVANELGKTLRVGCDTSETGADFLVQDDIQAFGRIFVDEGIRSENEATFIMNELDFDISEGDLHLRNSRIEEVGFAEGENVTLLSGDFSGGLTPFILLTTSGQPNEWTDTTSAVCSDSPCARASQIVPPADSLMEANITTIDFDALNLSFRINTTNFNAGDLLNVTISNNTGSGEVQVHAASGSDQNQLVSVILPTTMNNQSSISLRYHCSVNVINEQCFIDDVSIIGTATTSTLANVTRFDTVIKGGSTGMENIEIRYNDTAKQWQFSPNNVSFITVTEVDLNVTGSITLGGETITNWDNISTFDENVLLVNGSRSLTGNWNAGLFNITVDWFFGKLNWSDIQNAPAFALITDVQTWIAGNRTASEAALRVDIDGNFTALQNSKLNITDSRYNDTALILSVNTTDNIEALNFSTGPHTAPGGGADGTGGWVNDSVETSTNLNVNINGTNLTFQNNSHGIWSNSTDIVIGNILGLT